MQIPKNTYPFETLPFPQPYRDLTPVVDAERLLPWPVRKDRLPCRAWHPAHLWEIGALRKALYNELAILDEREENQSDCHRVAHCLEHILRCWDANLRKGYDSAGQPFLIHLLKLRSTETSALESEDARQIDVLNEACRETRRFGVLRARFYRIACGSYASPATGEAPLVLRVHRTVLAGECRTY